MRTIRALVALTLSGLVALSACGQDDGRRVRNLRDEPPLSEAVATPAT